MMDEIIDSSEEDPELEDGEFTVQDVIKITDARLKILTIFFFITNLL